MGKTEEDWNGLKLGFLIFLRLIPADCKYKNNVRETYLFVSNLWFCHLHLCNFFAYFKFYSDWGRVIGKLDKMNWTAVTQDVHDLHIAMATYTISPEYDFKWPELECKCFVKISGSIIRNGLGLRDCKPVPGSQIVGKTRKVGGAFYFRLRAFSIQRARLSRSLEQATA